MSEGWDQNAQLSVNPMGGGRMRSSLKLPKAAKGGLNRYLLLALRHFIKPPHGWISSSGHTTALHITVLFFYAS